MCISIGCIFLQDCPAKLKRDSEQKEKGKASSTATSSTSKTSSKTVVTSTAGKTSVTVTAAKAPGMCLRCGLGAAHSSNDCPLQKVELSVCDMYVNEIVH